jgi:hypothetical protein
MQSGTRKSETCGEVVLLERMRAQGLDQYRCDIVTAIGAAGVRLRGRVRAAQARRVKREGPSHYDR